MLGNSPLSNPKAMLLAITLVTGALAGCAATDDVTEEGFQSFEDVRNEPGKQVEPTSPEDSPLRIKVLEPNPDDTDASKKDWVILIWDSTTNEAVTNAEVTIQAWMPRMDHGTQSACTEEDPVHEEFGVYRGATCASMPGDWNVNIDVFPADTDGVVEFDVPMKVHDHEH